MLARAIALHRADARPLSRHDLGKREARVGAADIGRDDTGHRFLRPSMRSPTSDGSARVEVSPSAP
jgi:hypothetical protein